MGVTGLLGLLKSIQKPCSLKDFKGQTIGVDAYGWLHRGAVPCAIDLALGKATTKFALRFLYIDQAYTTRIIDFAMHRVRMLVHFGITPYIVFDGDYLPSKAETEKGREERRKESRNNGLELLRLGKTAQAHQELQKAVDITPEIARQLIEELKRNNIQYIVAPYEADSQLAYLEQKGLIDAILSEDSDLLVFGAKCLLTKLDQYGACVMIRKDDFTACRDVSLAGWTSADFRRMAILSGCDYLDGIPKMGLKTAHRLVKRYKTIERVLRCAQLEGKFRIPVDYMANFTQADMTFLYQWVFCPLSKCLVNLTKPDTEEQLSGLAYIGHDVEPKIAQGVAIGDLNPMTKLPIVVDLSPSNYRRTPLLTKAKSMEPSKGKPIESFFKPRRVPLAELDPNTFTPSPSQERLLQQNSNVVWSSSPAAASRPATAPLRSYFSIQEQSVSRLSSSAPHPFKRQRLCSNTQTLTSVDKDVDTSERSRFFSTSAPDPSPSLARGAQKRKTKMPEVNLWSDDSIEDAMALLPDFSSTPSSMPTTTKSYKSRRVAVFADEVTPQSNIEASATEPSTGIVIEQEPEENVFSKSLLAQTRELRNNFTYHASTVMASSRGTIPRPTAEPVTPPQSQKAIGSAVEIEDDARVAVQETPLAHQGSQMTGPTQGKSPTLARTALFRKHSSAAKLESPIQVSQGKGSEDLLVVPDSEEESECHDAEEDECEGGEGVEGLNGGSRLDLRRFAFSAVPG